jgi:tight adherence protein B
MNLFIAAVVSVAVLCIIEGLLLVLASRSTPEAKRIKKQIKELSKTSADEVSLVETSRPLSRVHWLNRFLSLFPLAKKMDDVLVQAGVSYPLGVFALLSAVLALMGCLLLFAASGSRVLSLFGLGLGAAPTFLLRAMKMRRIKKFEAQLPDALDMIARSLRAGHALTTGMEMTAHDFPDPLGPEFARTVAQIAFGVAIEQALRNLMQRLDCPDLKFLAASIIIQRESGGNLAGILQSIAGLIRERQKLRGKVRALSAEGKLSALILIALPFLIGGALLVMNPTYLGALLSDPLGPVLVVMAGVTMLIGTAVIRRMIDIKV